MGKIKPINTKILFQFVEDVDSVFHSRTKSGIHIVQDKANQVNKPRWGKVLAIGPEVDMISVGDYIFIEAMGWTNGIEFDDATVWFTETKKVMCATVDCPEDF